VSERTSARVPHDWVMTQNNLCATIQNVRCRSPDIHGSGEIPADQCMLNPMKLYQSATVSLVLRSIGSKLPDSP